MAEQSTNNITNNSATLANLITRADQSPLAQAVVSKGVNSSEVGASRPGDKGKSESSSKAEIKSPNLLNDVSLKFEIDSQTHEVTVLLLDRTSQRVVRTIPPEEISKLNPGDLLQLFI
jgi:uncharacterized FlaG/YvyC family protein